MLHGLHNSRLVLEDALGAFTQIVLRNDLECGLLLRAPVLDVEDDAEGAHS